MYFLVVFAVLLSLTSGFGLTNIKDLRSKYDYIIVGGGTTGCIVASRLSENPSVNVLVLEAGPSDKSVPLTDVPLGWADLVGSEIDWDYVSEPMTHGGQELINQRNILSAAKILGGSGSHNAMVYVRGSRHDFNKWRDLGNKGWAYADILPYFKKMENMTNPRLVANGFHGVGGPLTVIRAKEKILSRAFIDAGVNIGFKENPDYNGPYQEGFSILQHNIKDGRRYASAKAYIWSVIGRRNLHVITNAFVTKVEIKKKRATGVFFVHKRKKYYTHVQREVIVSAGALNSPKILMLSGIGPKRHLQDLGIPVHADLPVGNELNDHVFTYLDYFINKPLTILPETVNTYEALKDYVFSRSGIWTENGIDGVAFLKSNMQPKKDKFPYLQILQAKILPGGFIAKIKAFRKWLTIQDKYFKAIHGGELGRHGVSFYLVLNHPRTSGIVRLRSKDPFDRPKFVMNILKNPKDVEDLLYGIRQIQKLMQTPPYRKLGAKPAFPAHPGCSKYRYNSDDYWRCFLRYKSYSFVHYASSCKMAPDRTGVVDHRLRLKGIKGMRVADASILPMMVSSNTMTVCMMVGEKAADMIKQDNASKLKYV